MMAAPASPWRCDGVAVCSCKPFSRMVVYRAGWGRGLGWGLGGEEGVGGTGGGREGGYSVREGI